MTQKTCPDCNDYLYQDQMSSDLICYECETCFAKDFDEDEDEHKKATINQQKGTMTKKLLKLIDKLEEELIYINGAFDHIKSHVVDNKDQPIMSASTLTVDLSNGVNLINKIIEEKNKGVA